MPRAGRRPLSQAEKLARGTARRGREREEVDSPSGPLTTPPAEMPYLAGIVWTEYVAAATAHGARQCDADSFAEWCVMTANLRQARAAIGTASEALPPAAYLQQWRTLGELFGLAGPRSRVGQKVGAPAEPNPFAANGHR